MPGLLAIRTISLRLPLQVELNRNLILARLVRVRYLRVRNLKSRPILHIECKLCPPELCLSPVPPSKRMLFVLDRNAIPDLESLARAIEVLPNLSVPYHLALKYSFPYLQFKAIQLYDISFPCDEFQFISFRCTAPLRATNLIACQCKWFAAAARFPS
jgi:hypothetical protein